MTAWLQQAAGCARVGERHEGPEFSELEREKEWAEARIKTHEMAAR